MNFEVYCDESGLEALTRKDAHLFVAIGGVWIPSENRITLKEGVGSIKDKHNIKGETKMAEIFTCLLRIIQRCNRFFLFVGLFKIQSRFN